MLPRVYTSATRGQTDTADQCEQANDPEPTRQRLCTSKPDTTVPPLAFYGSDRPTCYRGTNRRASGRCLGSGD